jgi:drug/metabolite transporter (DMT)-like permease
MVAVGLALATALIWGAVDFVAGVKSRSSGPLAVIAISQPVGLVLIAVVTAARGEAPPDSAHLLYAAAAGAASVVGLTALYQGLAVGLMSVVAPITATGAVIPVLVGIARGENPSWLQGIGLPIALLGVVLASLEPRGTRQGQGRVAAGVGLALLGALGLGGFFVAFDAASEGSIWWAVLLQRATLVGLLVVPAIVMRDRLAPRKGDVWPVVAIGLCDVAALTMLAEATTRGLISVVSVIASLYPIGTVVLAQLVLGERVSLPQRFGVASACAGVGLLSAG